MIGDLQALRSRYIPLGDQAFSKGALSCQQIHSRSKCSWCMTEQRIWRHWRGLYDPIEAKICHDDSRPWRVLARSEYRKETVMKTRTRGSQTAMLLSAPNASKPEGLRSQSEASGCLLPPVLMYSRFTSGILVSYKGNDISLIVLKVLEMSPWT